jgi:hypothetical protein
LDPTLVAAGAAALLAGKAGESFATEAGKAAWERVRRLLASIRPGHAAHDDAAVVLAEAEADPGNPDTLRALALALQARADDDPPFAAELAELVRLAEGEPRVNSIMVGGRAIVGKIVTIGHVEGDVSF